MIEKEKILTMEEKILIVEDDPNDAFFIENAFRHSGIKSKPHICTNSADAIFYLQARGQYADRLRFPFPNLLVTDLKMPGGDGFELLRWLRDHPAMHVIPTIVISSSNRRDDVARAYSLGANAYLCKPTDPTHFRVVFADLLRFWTHCEVPETPASDGGPEQCRKRMELEVIPGRVCEQATHHSFD